MLVGALAASGAAKATGPDPASISADLLARAQGPGGTDVDALRRSVDQFARERPELGAAVRESVVSRLSLTDQAAFERASAKPSGRDRTLIVDDHRSASTLAELNSWEAGYRDAVRANGGPFANSPQIEAGFKYNREQLVAGTKAADAEVNKLLFVGLVAPAAGGAIGVAAPLGGSTVGSQFVSGLGGRVAYYATSSTIGGTANVGLEAGKNAVFHTEGSVGSYIGAAASGGLGATGIKLLGERAPKIANNIVLGARAGSGGEIVAQVADSLGSSRKSADIRAGLVATAIGAGTGALTPLEIRIGGLNTGRNNSIAVYEGLQTRISGGHVSQFQLRYGVAAGGGQATTGVAQGAVGAGLTGLYQTGAK